MILDVFKYFTIFLGQYIKNYTWFFSYSYNEVINKMLKFFCMPFFVKRCCAHGLRYST